MELSTKNFLQAENLVNAQNEALLKNIGEEYGKAVLDEIEYELFADTGSVGLHEIVDSPKGEYEESIVDGLKIKGAWFDFAPGICEHTKEAFDYSCYLKIKEGVFFKYNAIK